MFGDDDDADSTRATVDLQPETFTANTTGVRSFEACGDGLPVQAIVGSRASHTMISPTCGTKAWKTRWVNARKN